MASAKRKPADNRVSKGARKRKPSVSDEEGPAFLSSKYAERPTSKIYNSHFRNNTPAELFRKDLISAMKLPDSEPLCPEDFWYITDSWKPEWERGVQVPVNPEILPDTNMKILRKRRKDAAFKLPKKLIHLQQDSSFQNEVHILSYSVTHAERSCRYDMDDVDMQWLSILNEERDDFGLPQVEENVFELIMEELEVTCHDNFQEAIKNEEGLGVEYDEDAICDVCRSPDSEEGNEMVFCDSCNVCVHQACYGITKIPEGSWICRTCALGLRPSCILCPNKGGAMKSTRSGQKWSHVSCALWVPEVTIGCVEKMEPIIKISQIPVSRWALVCSLCKEKVGACIQCSVKFCKTAYHVTCAFENGLQMRAILDERDDDDDGIKLKSYCLQHSKKKKVSSDSESDTAKDENEVSQLQGAPISVEEKANLRQQKIQERESLFHNYVTIDELSGLFEVEEGVLKMIMNYWILKRKANFNRPLLPPKTVSLNSSFLEGNSEYGVIRNIVHLRRDLERARNLCYMVSKREKLARTWTKIKQEIFMKQAEMILDESTKLTKEESNAILLANYGDISYDKKYTGFSEAPANAIDVLNALMGQDYAKTHLNGMFKTNKKSERLPSQKNQRKEESSNPYAKHYLNGLLKRSQRWLATMDRQNRDKNSSSLNESAGQQKKKDNLEINFAGTSNDMRAQNADMEGHYLFSAINQDKNRPSERKCKGYLGSSSMKSLVSSQIKRELDVASSQQSVDSLSYNKEEKNTKFLNKWENSYGLVSETLNAYSSSDPLVCVKTEYAELHSDKLPFQKNAAIQESLPGVKGNDNYFSPSNLGHTDDHNEFKDKRKEPLKQEMLVPKNKNNLPVPKSNTDETEIKHQNHISKVNCEKNIGKTKAALKGSWTRRRKLKCLDKKVRVDSEESLEKSTSNSSLTKHKTTFNGGKGNVHSLNVSDDICLKNIEVDAQLCSHDEVESLETAFLKPYINLENSVQESRSSDEELLRKCSRLIEIPELQKENLKSKDQEFVSEDFKYKRMRKRGCKIKENSVGLEFAKEFCVMENRNSSPVEFDGLKCNNEDKDKSIISDAKFEVIQSVPCILSSPAKSDSDFESCDKKKLKSGSSDRTNSSEKVSSGEGKGTTPQKHKPLYSPETLSLSPVNKHQSLSPSNKYRGKGLSVNRKRKREVSPENLKTSDCSANIADSFFPTSALPKKGSLSGYKIPKKVKTDTDESSLEKKRGQSPLSPLAECSSSPSSNSSYPSNSYQSRPVKPWRNNQRIPQKPHLANGETESQSQRLVIKLRKDLSDPDSQRWKTDSSCNDKTVWTGELQSVPSSGQTRYSTPGSKQWTRLQTMSDEDRRPQRIPYGIGQQLT